MNAQAKPMTRTIFRYHIDIIRSKMIELNNTYVDFADDPKNENGGLDRLLEAIEAVLEEADLEKDSANA